MVDALTALVNLASAIHTSGNRFIFALAVVLGIYGVMFALTKEARLARQVPGHNGTGKIIGVVILGGMLVGLSQIINAGPPSSAGLMSPLMRSRMFPPTPLVRVPMRPMPC
ncbi:hypothetical protein RKJ08_29740 [Klebsiella pneumoniae]|nr:hypothetical protein [Klebsiella pneumoniae]